jgi:hypothetical protein
VVRHPHPTDIASPSRTCSSSAIRARRTSATAAVRHLADGQQVVRVQALTSRPRDGVG